MSMTYTIGAVHDKLALIHAIAQGYQIALAEDGCAEVTSPEGNIYFIYNFECDCPDKQLRGGLHQGRCKHEVWVSQITPCLVCDTLMYLGEFHSTFGEILHRFECRTCGHTCDANTIHLTRKSKQINTQIA